MNGDTPDHKDFLRSLDTGTRERLTARRDAPGPGHLALHWGMIGGLGGWIGAGLPFWQLLLVPQGILLVFLFTLLRVIAESW